MKLQAVSIAALTLLLASAASAQTKISGQHKCGKAEVVGTSEVGDKTGHTMSLVKNSGCPWTTPMEIEGLKTKDGSSVVFSDMTATRSSSSGNYVGNMDNGDKIFVSFHDSGAVKDGKPGPSKGAWSFTGGTGKMKGISGKGTYTINPQEDGGTVVDVEGEYSIAAAPMKKTAEKKTK